jgi:hypothetical protein
MSTDTDAQTIERTRTEVRVETEEVTETLYECENCGQAYEPEDVQTTGLDLDEDGDPVEKRILCAGCSNAIFGYEELEGREYVSRSLQEFDGGDVADVIGALSGAVVSVGASIATLLIPVAMIGIALRGISGVMSTVSSLETQTAIEQGNLLTSTILEFVPLVFTFVLLMVMIRAAATSPRRF